MTEHDGSCPNCGYCDKCGRRNFTPPTVPYYTYPVRPQFTYPYPMTHSPFWYGYPHSTSSSSG